MPHLDNDHNDNHENTAPDIQINSRENCGMMHRSNKTGSYHRTDRKTVLKQNRVIFYGIETYALINQHTIYLNSTNLVQDLQPKTKSGREFCFGVVRVRFAVWAKYSLPNAS